MKRNRSFARVIGNMTQYGEPRRDSIAPPPPPPPRNIA